MPAPARPNPIALYSLEKHLFATVSPRFHKEGHLSAFDFFCIIIWKSNRAKSKIAKRLLEKDRPSKISLNAIVRDLTSFIYKAADHRERLRLLKEDWGFRLPMASAILTVLYPDDFTVYDIRVCEQLGKFDTLTNKSSIESLWMGYTDFVSAVRKRAPKGLSLRDCDRHLWGLSFAKDLRHDIKTKFAKATPKPKD